jgi:DNA polymerase III subunit delta'
MPEEVKSCGQNNDPKLPSLLRRSLESGRLGHAYLLTGDNLDHLESVARHLAMTLNCMQPLQRFGSGLPSQPCRACSACRRIQADHFPDVQWARPESKLRVVTIDQVRQMMQTIHLKPLEAPYKISVLVAADRLNPQAANAFLKTLEEPPSNCVILLLSTEPQRVMETILSRCLRVDCGSGAGPVASDRHRSFLNSFATLAVESGQANLLARYRLLGILLDELAQARKEIEDTLRADSPLEQYEDVESKVQEKWEDELAAAIEAEYRLRRSQLLSLLQSWLRDVWLACQGHDPALFFFPELAPSTNQIAQRLDPASAQSNLSIINRTQRLLYTNVQEALTLEVGLLKLRF